MKSKLADERKTLKRALQARQDVYDNALNDDSILHDPDLFPKADGAARKSTVKRPKTTGRPSEPIRLSLGSEVPVRSIKHDYEAVYLQNAEKKWFVPAPWFAVWDGDERHYPKIFNDETGKREVRHILTSVLA